MEGVVAEADIESFWDSHPCGEHLVGSARDEYETFFARYDKFRYSLESHIAGCLDELHLDGKRTLEVGLGQGADSEQIIRRGARWSGLDLTQESIDRVRTRLALRHLPYDDLKKGSVLDIPYVDASFDVVYSHGVLHHVPDIKRAQAELARVLKPGGELIVMLYAKYSLNYFSIAVLRRLGLLAMMGLGVEGRGIYKIHANRARELGIRKYLALPNFLSRNTDGPNNPYSKVYEVAEVKRDFPCFRVVRAHKEFMHAPPLRVHGLPGARLFGWHLWVHLQRR